MGYDRNRVHKRSRSPPRITRVKDPRPPRSERPKSTDNTRHSLVDKDKSSVSTYRPAAKRYNPRVPYEVLNRTTTKATISKPVNKYDEALAEIKLARKRNQIRFPVLVESKNWPHGKITSYLINLVATKREVKLFDLLQEHIESERKGPTSLFDAINIATNESDEEPDLQALLMKR